MSDSENLLIHLEDGVATITFNRLKQRNAFDNEFIAQIQHALEEMANNPAIRVLKIKANGEYFCAGGDLNWFKNASELSEAENLSDALKLAHCLKRLNEFPKPTVAIVEGPTFGGGVGLVACCDIALATTSASFCLSEVKLGLVPATISPYVLRAIGSRQVRHYALTAATISAEEALRIGLIHSLCNEKDLKQTEEQLTQQLLSNAPEAMAFTKKLIGELLSIDNSEVENTAALLAKVRVSKEAQDGINAFLNKTEAPWRKNSD